MYKLHNRKDFYILEDVDFENMLKALKEYEAEINRLKEEQNVSK